jgi:RND family efflux transporter MFP subunit
MTRAPKGHSSARRTAARQHTRTERHVRKATPQTAGIVAPARLFSVARFLPPTRVLVGGILVSSLLLVACQRAATPAPAPPAAPLQPVTAEPAHRGDIQQALAFSGDIRAKSQINVLPKSTGRIEQLLVDVGSQVTAGDTIAVLDQDTPSMQVLQSRAALAQAQARLATLAVGPRSEDVAAAQAGTALQQVRLDNMHNQGRIEDVKAAEAGLAGAQAKLQSLKNGADDDVRQSQQSAVDADKAALASAEAAFAALGAQNAATTQGVQSQIDSLQAQIASAQAQIDSADAALSNLSGSSAADIQAAKSANDVANSQLQSAMAALKQAYNPTQASIAQAEAALEAARNQRSAAQANQTALIQNVAGACAKVTVAPGVTINPNSTACSAAQAAADEALNSAEAAVVSAQGQLDLLKRGGAPAQQTQLQAAADQAQAQVNSTKARLDALKNGGVAATRAQVEAQKQQAQGQLVQAQESLKTAQANLKAVTSGNLDALVKSAQAQVTAATERLKSDESKLEVIDRGPRDADLDQAQAGIDQARQQLLKARQPFTTYDIQAQEQAVVQAAAQLQKAQNPFTDQDMAAAQAAVDAAQAQLDIAQLALKETTVQAPVGGTISDRLVSLGALVNPQTPLVTLIPPDLELVVNVEENQLGQVAAGQRVQLAVAAFPAQSFDATVRTIAPTVDTKSRTAAVRIEPSDPASKLRAGMFARLNIITGAKQNALLVPRSAIVNAAGGTGPMVLTIDDTGKVHKQDVTLGLQDDKFSEVVAGVDNGQLVATTRLNDLREGEIVAPQVETRTASVAR